ncbi:MAG TPA: hypothetical protein VFZ04_22135 [Longimicrobiales bacterium]
MLTPRARLTMLLLRWHNAETVRFLNETLAAFEQPARYDALCARRLDEMLRWCRAIPFYRARFDEAKLFDGDRLNVERLNQVRPLTKADIRQHFGDLQHPEPQTGRYENTSGGSTGEPVRLIQDRRYHARAVADTLLFGILNDKHPGEREVKLWGSERDILEGTIGAREKLINRVFNRVLLNAFSMTSDAMRRYCETINAVRPVQIWTYVDSILELARFAQREGISLYNPRVVVCTAGTLYPEMRAELERCFPSSRIVNQYGSREVGQIASEAIGVDGLWLMRHSNHVVLVDEQTAAPVTEPNRAGRVLVTTLNNYSMPLVRFDIGDIAELAPRRAGQHTALARLWGRDNAHFITANGDRIHGEYFTHLFYGQRWLQTFQVAQTAPDKVEVRYVPANGHVAPAHDLDAIKEKIRRVMGNNTEIAFESRPRLERLASGKFQFVKREFS